MQSFLALGSNIGNRYKNLFYAIKKLNNHSHIWVVKKSYIYESEPMYNLKQDYFYNMVLEIETNLEILDLFNYIQTIEKSRGRKKTDSKNMPRILDIDILTFANLIIDTSILKIPHIKIKERKFVLKPWNDIASNFLIPRENETVKQLLEKTTDKSKLNMILDIECN